MRKGFAKEVVVVDGAVLRQFDDDLFRAQAMAFEEAPGIAPRIFSFHQGDRADVEKELGGQIEAGEVLDMDFPGQKFQLHELAAASGDVEKRAWLMQGAADGTANQGFVADDPVTAQVDNGLKIRIETAVFDQGG